MADVVLRGVTKRFGTVNAVQEINLTIHDREFFVLLGPSGCGKTTTLRMVAGLEEVSDGHIIIGDRDVSDVPPKDRNIAMVFQNYALYPHMTVYDNMAFGLKLRKFSKVEIDQRVSEAAEILDLTPYLQRRPKELSGGQRQRVALGRAIVRDPAVFLMDEPLSNLDAKLRTQTRVELKRLHERMEATILYVTHDQTEAMTLGTRIVVMNDGQIQQVGTPDEIYHHPANQFVATFVGTPPMNLMTGSVSQNGPGWIFRTGDHSLPLPSHLMPALKHLTDDRAVIGIRPEDLRLGVPEDPSRTGSIPGVIRLIEPMGHESIVHLDIAEQRVLARVGNDWSGAVDDVVRVALNPDRLHLFDPNTEQALY